MKKFLIAAMAILAMGCARQDEDPFQVDYNDAWMLYDKDGNAQEVVYSPVVIGKGENLTVDAVSCDKEFKVCCSFQYPFDEIRLEKVSYDYARKVLGLK